MKQGLGYLHAGRLLGSALWSNTGKVVKEVGLDSGEIDP